MSLVVMAHECRCHGTPVLWCTVSREMWCTVGWEASKAFWATEAYGRNAVGGLIRSKNGRLPPAPPPTQEELSRARATARGVPTPEVLVTWRAHRRAEVAEVAAVLERRARRRRKS